MGGGGGYVAPQQVFGGELNVYCQQCSQSGVQNRCYITGYTRRCGHDCGWARPVNMNGSNIIACNQCGGGNSCFVTGYDVRCGHDCGWAYYN